MSDLTTKGMGGHHSHNAGKDEWLTPPHIIRALGRFDLDPCAPVVRPWPMADQHFTADGLNQEWKGRVWCNPPYGRETGKWLARCAEHRNAIALVFARTETRDWVDHVWGKAHAIMFLHGRLHFHHVNGDRAKSNSGAPSALISYSRENTQALKSSGIAGSVVPLVEWIFDIAEQMEEMGGGRNPFKRRLLTSINPSHASRDVTAVTCKTQTT